MLCEKGLDLLFRIVVGLVCLVLFLLFYVGVAWSGVDLANRVFGGSCDGCLLTLGVFMVGLVIFIEKKFCWMELVMYCMLCVIEIVVLMVVYCGFVLNWI